MQVSTFFLSILPVTVLMVLFSIELDLLIGAKILFKDFFIKHVFIRFLSHALLGLFGLIFAKRANMTYEKTFP
jgi:hypothetical protein